MKINNFNLIIIIILFLREERTARDGHAIRIDYDSDRFGVICKNKIDTAGPTLAAFFFSS